MRCTDTVGRTLPAVPVASASSAPGPQPALGGIGHPPQRVLNFATWIAAALTGSLGVLQTFTGDRVLYIGVINLALAAVFLAIPLLHRFRRPRSPRWCSSASPRRSPSWAARSAPTRVCGSTTWCRLRSRCWCWVWIIWCWPDSPSPSARARDRPTVPGAAGHRHPTALGTERQFVFATAGACLLMFATVWYAMREIERAGTRWRWNTSVPEALLANILPGGSPTN